MNAQETRVLAMIEGTKQYQVPMFQRPYSWTKKEFGVLWGDIEALCEAEEPRPHFLGSTVCMPATSVPQGVAKFLLIDGQQRLTTLFIFLAALRDKARAAGSALLAEEINNTMLLNAYKSGDDHYKLMPTQADRHAFRLVMDGKPAGDGQTGPIWECYKFFRDKLLRCGYGDEKVKSAIADSLALVSIVLGADDNPYLVFESLNAKGRPLTQADLIKNYFFMHVEVSRQEDVYRRLWEPMQNNLGDHLSEFIRHYMMKDGGVVRQSDVYYELKTRVRADNAMQWLEALSEYSGYYHQMLAPATIGEAELRRRFRRIDCIEVRTAYPLLLRFWGDYAHGKLTGVEFCAILDTLENFVIRRFVCGVPTNAFTKIFPAAPPFIDRSEDAPAGALRCFLADKGYPKDAHFKEMLTTAKLYGGGDRQKNVKFILATIEENYGHKEEPGMDNLTVEHIIPQTLTAWWAEQLGDDFQAVADKWLHTLGNLTLTAYNAELSNKDYPDKQRFYADSHLELNRYFADVPRWGAEQIAARADKLAERALGIWPYFGPDQTEPDQTDFAKPVRLTIEGTAYDVKTWRDVVEQTFNHIASRYPDRFPQMAEVMPAAVNSDRAKLRSVRKLANGYYIETNRSAKDIRLTCLRALNCIGVAASAWSVATDIDDAQQV